MKKIIIIKFTVEFWFEFYNNIILMNFFSDENYNEDFGESNGQDKSKYYYFTVSEYI